MKRLLVITFLFPLFFSFFYEGGQYVNAASIDSNMVVNPIKNGKYPPALTVAKDPVYPIDSRVVIRANHVPGMEGAKAVVNAVYETTAYKVSYIPTTSSEEVKNYKWVIHEDIEGANSEAFDVGEEIILNVKYKNGMDRAKAKIESVVQTNVYMVSYIGSRNGEKVKNYKWLIESELLPLKEK